MIAVVFAHNFVDMEYSMNIKLAANAAVASGSDWKMYILSASFTKCLIEINSPYTYPT